MAPIRYSLHYEDYSEHLMSRFGKLLQMQSLVDMTLMCSSHTLRVHKAVLAASSAYFQEVLQKQLGEPLIILKMRFSVLKCLVEFMYCGKTQCLEENLDELVSAAQFLKIKGLSKVTKEGLGITNSGELPAFTPPVVINRPPQSIIDMHSQATDKFNGNSCVVKETEHKGATQPQPATATSVTQSLDAFGRPNKDTVVRIPFDIENGTSTSNVDYPELPRAIKPRRGRPSVRRSGGWEGPGHLGRAAERALLRREQDSRKAIHQLKHLQIKHMQDYMDRMSLSQAVNSICGPESSNNYMNMQSDLMYQNVAPGIIDPNVSYSKDSALTDIPSSYVNTSSANANPEGSDGISNAMSQYVNALKNAGLPTDLPILFESGDGSYINVNEQVLLDMVQSSEIQYEVIEQPNIIEKVADPSEIKSIDDLSKSIERGEMLIGNKSYPAADFKDPTHFNQAEDTMNGLNNILPDNLESFADQQNYVVLDSRLQDNNSLDHVGSNEFSCIDGDLQFFTKSMSDDVKKYYQDDQLSDARVMEQLCPPSSSLDTNFNISLLDAKPSQLNDNLNQQYNPLNTEDIRRNEDCYDFSLHLPQNNVFKEDLDCLIATPRRNDDDGNSYELDRERAQAKEEIIKDLMSIESKIIMKQETSADKNTQDSEPGTSIQDFALDVDMLNESGNNEASQAVDRSLNSSLQWDGLDINNDSCRNNADTEITTIDGNHVGALTSEADFGHSVIDLIEPTHSEPWDDINRTDKSVDKENESPLINQNNFSADLENDVPYAVGLLPMKKTQRIEDGSLLKRKCSKDIDSLDSKCLKRRAKKKL